MLILFILGYQMFSFLFYRVGISSSAQQSIGAWQGGLKWFTQILETSSQISWYVMFMLCHIISYAACSLLLHLHSSTHTNQLCCAWHLLDCQLNWIKSNWIECYSALMINFLFYQSSSGAFCSVLLIVEASYLDPISLLPARSNENRSKCKDFTVSRTH